MRIVLLKGSYWLGYIFQGIENRISKQTEQGYKKKIRQKARRQEEP